MQLVSSLRRLGAQEIAAAVIALLLILIGREMIVLLAQPFIAAASRAVMAGATPATLERLQTSALHVELILSGLVALCGSALAAAAAMATSRGLVRAADPVGVGALVSLLVLVLSLLLGFRSWPATIFPPVPWMIAIAVPGLLLGLPLGGGQAMREAYSPGVVAGLGAIGAVTIAAILLVPHLLPSVSPGSRLQPLAIRPPAVSETVAPAFRPVTIDGQPEPPNAGSGDPLPGAGASPPPQTPDSFPLGQGSTGQLYDGPDIEAVSAIVARPDQAVTIRGSRLGRFHPYDGLSPYLRIRDLTQGWAAGMRGARFVDAATLSVGDWSDSEITLCGFSGALPQPGDQIEIQLWNPQTALGPATFDTTVRDGTGNPCTAGRAGRAATVPSAAPAGPSCLYPVERPCGRTKWEPGDPGPMCGYLVSRACRRASDDTEDWSIVGQALDLRLAGAWHVPGHISGSNVTVSADSIQVDGRITDNRRVSLTASHGVVIYGRAGSGCGSGAAIEKSSGVALAGQSIRIDGGIGGKSAVDLDAPDGSIELSAGRSAGCPADTGIGDESRVTAKAKSIRLDGSLVGSIASLAAPDGEVTLTGSRSLSGCSNDGTIAFGSSATIIARQIRIEGGINGSAANLNALDGAVALAFDTGPCQGGGGIDGGSQVTITAGSIRIDGKIGGGSTATLAAINGGVAVGGTDGQCPPGAAIGDRSTATITGDSIEIVGPIYAGSNATLQALRGPASVSDNPNPTCHAPGDVGRDSKVRIEARSIRIDGAIRAATLVELTSGDAVAIGRGVLDGAHVTIRAKGSIVIGGPVAGPGTEVRWCGPSLVVHGPLLNRAEVTKLPDCAFPGEALEERAE